MSFSACNVRLSDACSLYYHPGGSAGLLLLFFGLGNYGNSVHPRIKERKQLRCSDLIEVIAPDYSAPVKVARVFYLRFSGGSQIWIMRYQNQFCWPR